MNLKSRLLRCLPIILIIIIASFLRLYNLAPPASPSVGLPGQDLRGRDLPAQNGLPPGLYPDEAMNGNNALEALSAGLPGQGQFKIFYPENNGREGLFINIQAVFIKFLGLPAPGKQLSPWVLRLPSAIFGILTVLGLYFLTKELFKKSDKAGLIAFLSALFLATSFWHINFSRIGFRAIMAPAFLVWGLFLFLKSLNQTEDNFQSSISKNKKFWILPVLAGLIYGLGFYSYIAYRATPLLILLIIFLYRQQIKNNWKPIFYFLIFTFLIALPLGIYFLNNPADFMGRTGQLSVFSSPTPLKDLGLNILKTAGMFNISGDWNWRHNIAGKPELFWPVGILFLIGILFAIKHLIQNSKIFDYWKSGFGILFGWLITTAIPVVISNEGIPHALRAIIMIPPVFIFAGIGGYQVCLFLEKIVKNKIVRIGFYALFVLIFTYQAYFAYFMDWGQNPNISGAFAVDYVKIGQELNSLPRETPKYIVVEAPGALVRGIPMPAQTVMFITNSFTPEKQRQKNIHYILPEQIQNIPEKSFVIYLK